MPPSSQLLKKLLYNVSASAPALSTTLSGNVELPT